MNEPQETLRLIDELRATPQLFEEIANATGETELSLQRRLRDQFPPDLVRLAVTLSELRRRAADKFSQADRMWFQRIGFEQSTAEAVAMHKAQRFSEVATVYDLCSGIGMDSIALAHVVQQVKSVDLSVVAVRFAALNAAVYGVDKRIDSSIGPVEEVERAGQFVHIDPDRRVGKSRAIRLEDYVPSLDFLQDLTAIAAGGAIKLSPASNFGGKFPDAEIELVSLYGECKEATVWFGELRRDDPWRATILPAGFTISGDPLFARAPIREIGTFLYDPDPALVRAGLIDHFCAEHGLARLDDAEEYLTSETFLNSPAVRGFEVQAVLPNNDKEIRKFFRQNPCGDVEIKCRHIPVKADQVRKKLPLDGVGRTTLVFARLMGKTKAVICKRVEAHDEQAN